MGGQEDPGTDRREVSRAAVISHVEGARCPRRVDRAGGYHCGVRCGRIGSAIGHAHPRRSVAPGRRDIELSAPTGWGRRRLGSGPPGWCTSDRGGGVDGASPACRADDAAAYWSGDVRLITTSSRAAASGTVEVGPGVDSDGAGAGRPVRLTPNPSSPKPWVRPPFCATSPRGGVAAVARPRRATACRRARRLRYEWNGSVR